jgi:hypothetical protein
MSASPQATAPNPHTNLLNVYIQIANKMGFQKNILLLTLLLDFFTVGEGILD